MESEKATEVLQSDKEKIDAELSRLISTDDERFERITKAMRYSALGGKRLRGILTMEFAKMFGADSGAALRFACAVECIQAYSLIHDDLPCMDDDDFRRGKPSCHKAFGEAVAVLAGDALLTYAFELAAGAEACRAEDRSDAIYALAGFAGFRGMVGGQTLDIDAAERRVGAKELDDIHELKTAALFRACAAVGCSAAGASENDRNDADDFAYAFGRAFQIADDINDKNAGEEPELNSYVIVNGEEKALADLENYIKDAKSAVGALSSRGYDVSALNSLVALIECDKN